MKTTFLASSTISSESVLRCYDWATELPRHVVVVSGFQSKIEKDVLQLLLKTGHTAIMALGRTIYKKIPDHLAEPLSNGQLEIISTSAQSRQTKESAHNRNKQIIEMCDEVVFGTLHPDSSLYTLYEYAKELNKPTIIL
ncbi:MAG: hypothetical protein SNH07_00515 [Rikenellaceae bacterium]